MRPKPQYLLPAQDRVAIESLLARGATKDPDDRKALCDFSNRIYSLVGAEARARVAELGISPKEGWNHVSNGEAWALLSPERRAFVMSSSLCSASSSGLAQAILDREDEARGFADAARMLDLEKLGDEIAWCVEWFAYAMALHNAESHGGEPPAPRADFDPERDNKRTEKLEREVWDTDWTTL